MINRRIWEKVNAYQIAGNAYPLFIEKLQQATGWDTGFTLQAIEEYKRFMYLSAIANQSVSPSKHVDTVWSVHLTFSRCYWMHFCEETLGKVLHHEPQELSNLEELQEPARYVSSLYKQEFGCTPNPAIWSAQEPAQNAEQGKSWLVKALTGLTLGTGLVLGSSFALASSQVELPIALQWSDIYNQYGGGILIALVSLFIVTMLSWTVKATREEDPRYDPRERGNTLEMDEPALN